MYARFDLVISTCSPPDAENVEINADNCNEREITPSSRRDLRARGCVKMHGVIGRELHRDTNDLGYPGDVKNDSRRETKARHDKGLRI